MFQTLTLESSTHFQIGSESSNIDTTIQETMNPSSSMGIRESTDSSYIRSTVIDSTEFWTNSPDSSSNFSIVEIPRKSKIIGVKILSLFQF